MRIYLAGGFATNWQDDVIKQCYGHSYLNPREHGLDRWQYYSAWDLNAIEHCDWVFAYFEADNSSGYGLVLEVGFAKGLGKRVIFCDEISAVSNRHKNHLRIVEFASDVYFTSFDDACRFLRSLPLSTDHRLTNAI